MNTSLSSESVFLSLNSSLPGVWTRFFWMLDSQSLIVPLGILMVS